MNLENKLKIATENHSWYKKLRNNFYIAVGATGMSVIGTPYLYQTLNQTYNPETASEIVLLSGLIIGEISFLFNQLYKTYSKKTIEVGKKIIELRKTDN